MNMWDRARRKYAERGLPAIMGAVFNRALSARSDIQWGIYKQFAKMRGLEKVRSAYGVYMVPNWDDATFCFCMRGSYGDALSNMLQQKTKPFAFIDIGANQGLYTILAARNNNCRQVIALEPVARTFDLLKRNVQMNEGRERVTTLSWAISDRKGIASISDKANHSGVASLERWPQGSGENEQSIELHTFDELESILLDKNVPIFIKIDVEGHELAVLRSIATVPTVCRRLTDLFYEVDERWVSVGDLQAQVQRLGLNRFRNIGSGLHRDIYATR